MARAKVIFGANDALLKLLDGDRTTLAEIGRQALTEAAERWHRHTLPLHFEPSARSRYRPAAGDPTGVYELRSKSYERRKRKLGSEGRPMVYTGVMRATLTRIPPRFETRRGRTKMHVRIRTAHHQALNLWKGAASRGKSGKRKHDFEKSLTIITPDEARGIQQFLRKRMRDLVQQRLDRAQMVFTEFVG